MRVVVVESVREYAVQQHGVAKRELDRHPDDGVRAVFAEPEQSGERAMAEIEARRGECRADDVQHVKLRAFSDAFRDALRRHRGDEFGDVLRNTRLRRGVGSLVQSGSRGVHGFL
jgi:hypothetical protein